MKTIRGEMAQVSLLGNRQSNQDRCAIIEGGSAVLLVLADGMGGHPRGEVAAQLLVETCEAGLRKAQQPVPEPRLLLSDLVRTAHDNIVRWGYRQQPPIDPRTTAVVAMIQQGKAFWAHVGDSRCYLYRNGRVVQQTTDHSYVQYLRQQGMIKSREIDDHPFRNYVTRCLGGENYQPEISHGAPTDLSPGDVLLLCSDGFWGNMKPEVVGNTLNSTATLEAAVSRLAHQAEAAAYPESDNVTVAAVRWLGEAQQEVSRATSQSAASDSEQTAADATGGDPVDQAIDELRQAIETFESEFKQE